MTTEIEVTLNGEARSLPAGTTVAEVVATLDRGPAGIAVARNGEVVLRSTWSETVVAHGDHLEVLTAVQGG